MAGRVIPLQIGDVELLAEVAPVAGSEATSARLDRAQDVVNEAFDRAQTTIAAVASSTVSTISQLSHRGARPDELQIRFGLKFSAQGNVIMAGAAGEASLEVTLLYRAGQSETSNGAD